MIKIEKNNDINKKDTILARLKAYNRGKCRWLYDNAPLDSVDVVTKEINLFATDGDKLVGGAIGFVEYNWYVLDLLYVDGAYRGQNIGTALMKQVEAYSQDLGLTGIKLETWDFQAKGFYEKNGFSVFAELKDCPPGTTVYYLKKHLKERSIRT